MSQQKDNELITQTEVLSMGWTKSMIQKFLPEPILNTNPRFSSAAPMKLWDKETVLKTMQTGEFQIALEKAKKRSRTSSSIADKKRKELFLEVDKITKRMQIKRISDNVLLTLAIDSKRDWEYEKGNFNFEVPDDPAIVDRWVVNYIRHNLVNYDDTLEQIKGKVGKDEAYRLLKTNVLKKIAVVYPKYKAECYRQIDNINNLFYAFRTMR